MDGVVILNMTEEYVTIFPAWAVVACALLSLFCAVAAIIELPNENISTILFALSATFALAFIISVFPKNISEPNFIYEVVVAEDASMAEFYDKYEVIEQRGKIYKVKEKGNG